MPVTCPNCNVTVQLIPSRVSGSIYTSSGVKIRGAILEDSGLTHRVSPSYHVSAYFDLEGAQYRIAKCTSCNHEFVAERFSDRVLWPLPNMAVSEDIPGNIRQMFIEAQKAYAVGAETASLLAARTALIRMLRDQSCSSFIELRDNGKLTQLLYEQANEIRLWATMTGHEEVSEDNPTPEDVKQLLDYLDILFDTLYVQPVRLKEIRDRRIGTS